MNDILHEALLCEGGNDSCVTVALFIVKFWKMLMLNYETSREEDSRYRNNKHEFNCELKRQFRNSCGVYVLILFSIKTPIVNLK